MGLHVEVDQPLDLEAPIDFDNPLMSPPYPSYYAVLPSLTSALRDSGARHSSL